MDDSDRKLLEGRIRTLETLVSALLHTVIDTSCSTEDEVERYMQASYKLSTQVRSNNQHNG
jgi:hypothetical protein